MFFCPEKILKVQIIIPINMAQTLNYFAHQAQHNILRLFVFTGV